MSEETVSMTPADQVTEGEHRRVLVCGGRSYEDWKTAQRVLSALHQQCAIDLLISGGAPGADRLGEKWASINHVPLMVFPAHWHHMGRRAGPVRNGWMLQFGQPDLVVAMPGGPGTENMIMQAKARGLLVLDAALSQSGEA